MSGEGSPGLIALLAGVALLLLLVDLALSVLLLSVTALSRVALRRLDQEAGGDYAFLEEIRSVGSAHRAAVHVARQACLLGFVTLAAVLAAGAGSGHPWRWAVGAGGTLAVLVVETVAARALAVRDPRAALRATAGLLRPLFVVATPVLSPLARLFRRWAEAGRVQEEEREDDVAAEAEVEAFLEVGEREGILEAGESAMVRGIVDLDETRVREIMTPRTDIEAVSADDTAAEARAVVIAAGYSRLPVFRENLDNVIGIVHGRDLLKAAEEGRDAEPVSRFARPALFVPETRTVAELLGEMRQRTHIALVVDEYGGLAGLVTLEDILEEIVGDIRDEHDSEEAQLQPQPDGTWLVSALAHVEEVEDLFGLDLPDRTFDTVGGLVVSTLGRVPAAGEAFVVQNVAVEVVEADPRRVYRVRMRSLPADRGPTP
jgi:CBS domain containing-hemolysin-like protein